MILQHEKLAASRLPNITWQVASLFFFAILVVFANPASATLAVSTSSQLGSLPLTPNWTAAGNSLIAGLVPSVATGNFGEYTGANVNNLTTSGVSLTIHPYSSAPNLEVCGNDGTAGSSLIYTLPTAPNGQDLTTITVYGGWQDGGRDSQDYTISYSTITNPGIFVPLTSVSYNPSNSNSTACATRVTINDSLGAAIAKNVSAIKFDFTTPASENSACGYTAITVQGTASSTAPPPPIFGSSPISEPYPYVTSGSFNGPVVPLSPDPLVAYNWPNPQASDGLEIYLQQPKIVSADTPGSFANLPSLLGTNPNVTVNGLGSIQMDFGQENAAWLEFDSPDLNGAVTMSISEYNVPEITSGGAVNNVKTLVPTKYGNTYRLELNSQLYEGVRFGWIHVTSFTSPWHITGLRLVCQTKPANYKGSFSCSNDTLTRLWYTGAYTVKLNLLSDSFGAILIERGDRISWTGDDHCAQAAALVAFGNDDFIKESINNTATQSNGIASYSLYWVLSLIDYYNYTGDSATVLANVNNAQAILDGAYAAYGTNPNLTFYGWDERLGAGFENANCPEAENAYKMLSIRAWKEFATALGTCGRTDLQTEYNGEANEKIAALRQNHSWYQSFGLHACADAVNTGLLNAPEEAGIFQQEFTDRVNRISFSPFNQYFVIQAFAGMDKYDDALSSINDLWGGEINYGGTTFFEVYRPSWNAVIGTNDPVPNCQAGFTSLCHPWSAGVTKWLSEEVLGIKPTSPGFQTYQILPHLGSSLTSVSGTTPTPFGSIQASFNVSTGLCSISAPSGTIGTVGIPKLGKTITRVSINGAIAWDGSFHLVPGINGANQNSEFLNFTGLQPGVYSFTVSYSGATPAYTEPPIQYAGQFIKQDSITSGNWGGVYGKDGYVLCNYNGNANDVRSLPSYVSAVTYNATNPFVWASSTTDSRALASSANNQPSRTAACLFDGNQANVPSMTCTINTTGTQAHQVALYFVDWDNRGRQLAVEMMDATSLNQIAPVEVIKNFTGGCYLVYSYNKSVKFRIDEVQGPNDVLSGIFFDPVKGPTAFSQWEAGFGINSGPAATPFNDGIPNLLKYFYDINPSVPMSAADRAALPVGGMDTTTDPGTTYLTLTYRQYAAETGLTTGVQTSSDLQTWTTVSPDLNQQIGTDAITGDPIIEVGVKATGPMEFIRLNVTLP